MRSPGDAPGAPPAHVLVLATLGAAERRRLSRRRRPAEPEPEPVSVSTGRATIIATAEPLADAAAGARWLHSAGEEALLADLAVLNRALHAFRLVTADPYVAPVARGQTIAARVGFGAGEEVADGRWTEARELVLPRTRTRRSKVLEPQARLAAALGQREPPLVCAELALRGHLDLEHGRDREAALQVLVALDAAIAELSVEVNGSARSAGSLGERVTELRGQRDAVAAAAQSALGGGLSDEARASVAFTLGRIEAALRARAAVNA